MLSSRVRRRMLALFLCWSTLFTVSSANHPTPAPVSEYALKAAYIFNFVRYVSWPERAFVKSDTSIEICVKGSAEIAGHLAEAAQSRKSHGRAIKVQAISQHPSLYSCHLVYVAQRYQKQATQWIAAAGDKPILWVGGSHEFLKSGGGIALVEQHQKLEFNVNLAALQERGLQARSQLLRVANKVEREAR